MVKLYDLTVAAYAKYRKAVDAGMIDWHTPDMVTQLIRQDGQVVYKDRRGVLEDVLFDKLDLEVI